MPWGAQTHSVCGSSVHCSGRSSDNVGAEPGEAGNNFGAGTRYATTHGYGLDPNGMCFESDCGAGSDRGNTGIIGGSEEERRRAAEDLRTLRSNLTPEAIQFFAQMGYDINAALSGGPFSFIILAHLGRSVPPGIFSPVFPFAFVVNLDNVPFGEQFQRTVIHEHAHRAFELSYRHTKLTDPMGGYSFPRIDPVVMQSIRQLVSRPMAFADRGYLGYAAEVYQFGSL